MLRDVPSATLDLYGYASPNGTVTPHNCRLHPALADGNAMAAAMARAGAVVVPSRFEVSPLVAAEAMAVGVPLVATDVGGVRAMCDGVARLCRFDAGDLADGIVSALRDDAARQQRVQTGRERSATYGSIRSSPRTSRSTGRSSR